MDTDFTTIHAMHPTSKVEEGYTMKSACNRWIRMVQLSTDDAIRPITCEACLEVLTQPESK